MNHLYNEDMSLNFTTRNSPGHQTRSLANLFADCERCHCGWSRPPLRRTGSSSWSWETGGQTQTADNRRYNRCSHILSLQFCLTFALTFSTDDLHLPSYLLSLPNTPPPPPPLTIRPLSPTWGGGGGGGCVLSRPWELPRATRRKISDSDLRGETKLQRLDNLSLQLLHTLVVICSHKEICQ